MQIMYPFGIDQGDAVLDSTDNGGTGPIKLAMNFPFFNATYDSLYVSMQASSCSALSGVVSKTDLQ
jgi:hypothetical protein